jgi:hypothetical protein
MPKTIQATLATFLLLCTLTAQDKGMWRASSNTAHSITGDVALSDEKLTINFSSFIMSRIRSLEAVEISTIFDADSTAEGAGSLYRLNIPATKKFLGKNTLCGTEDIQWMVTYVSGRSLKIAFFSSQRAPILTHEAISNSTDLCGIFAYAK